MIYESSGTPPLEGATLSCVVLGSGGHTKVLLECIYAAGSSHVYGLLDPDQGQWGQIVMGTTILGGDELLEGMRDQGVTHFAVGVGNVVLRERLYELGLRCKLEPLTVVHPSVLCSPRAEVGIGVQLLPGAVVNTGTVIDDNAIVNSGAIVEHDCIVGMHSHVATGARLAGGVRVGHCAFVGMGACVIQNVKVGNSAVVGAGAVVIDDVPDNTVVVGVPAKPTKRARTGED